MTEVLLGKERHLKSCVTLKVYIAGPGADHFWSVLSNLQCFRDAAIMPNHMHSAPSILYFLLEPDFDALPEALQTICLEVQDFAAMRIMQNTLSSHHAQAMLQVSVA